MIRTSDPRLRRLLVVSTLAPLVVFAPGVGNDFVDWDDNLNFVTNPYYRGLGWTELRWMLTATVTGHYIPVTWMTLGLDYVLWGMNPAGYHLTNLVLHALNTVLFALIAIRLLRLARPRTGETALWAGTVTAALFFSLHPLRAETVAWVTERRGLLSAFFSLVTALTYVRMAAAEGAPRRRWLAVSVGSYAMALASKAAVVPLPLVLLLMDVYPLGRLPARWRTWGAPEARAVWREKGPYAPLARRPRPLDHVCAPVGPGERGVSGRTPAGRRPLQLSVLPALGAPARRGRRRDARRRDVGAPPAAVRCGRDRRRRRVDHRPRQPHLVPGPDLA